MNTLYNTAIIETRGVRTITGGGTNSSTVSGALSSLFVPNNISVASNTITIGTSGFGTLNVSTSATGTINVGTSGSGIINVGISGTGTVNALGVSKFAYLTANGANIGPAIANFGLPTISLLGNAVYELVYDAAYIKTTTGTIVYTLVGTTTFTSVNGLYIQGPGLGVGTNGAATAAAVHGATTASIILPATGNLTTALNHRGIITYLIRTTATANNVYLAATNSTGTITPLANSYYKLTRVA